MGRATEYDPAIADKICSALADARSLRSICLDDGMPAQSTVFKWLSEQPSFSEQYARAREAQADAIFDEMLDIADDGSNDWMKITRQDGSTDEVLNHEHVQRSKLRIDARKWMAGKLRPKVYGDKLEVEHQGGVTLTITSEDAGL
jgi:hypothetical protein